MKTHFKIIRAGLLITVFCICGYGQINEFFASGDGGFKLNLPKTPTSIEEVSINSGSTPANGKVYSWVEPQAYAHQILYYKLDTPKKTLAPAEKKLLLNAFKEGLLKKPKEEGLPIKEMPFTANGLQGIEMQVIMPRGILVSRAIAVGKRLYFMTSVFGESNKIDEAKKILDSFALLDSKTLIAVKIEEATPKPLPQSPIAEKRKSDAQDNNLKGKVKSVIEDIQEPVNSKRARFLEKYYNESGNLTKEMSYEEGYPSDVTVWGYIDGNRVNSFEFIDFDDDQRPPMKNITIRGTPVGEEKPNLPKDERYYSKHKYRYDDQGRLVEEWTYSNDGSLRSRTAYNYADNKRTEINYGADGSEWSQTVEFLDQDGNITERHLLDENGKASDKTVYSYEFDSQGNWIVAKRSDKKTFKGKTILKPWSVSYRMITYYP